MSQQVGYLLYIPEESYVWSHDHALHGCIYRFDADFVADSIHSAVFLVYSKADRTAGAR
jgi:hypothetical protein